MSTLTLPEPIAAYFVADTQGSDAVARCFTPQGVVTDKRETHVGREAIATWKSGTMRLYTYTNEPFSLETIDGFHVVRSHTEGDFAGSPIDMTLAFRLERGLIASLEITA